MTFARLKIILANRQPHLEQAGVRYSVLEQAVAEFEALCDRICKCERPDAFRIPGERDTPAYVCLEQARVDRLQAADEVAEAVNVGRSML
jgi:hypothetical protein